MSLAIPFRSKVAILRLLRHARDLFDERPAMGRAEDAESYPFVVVRHSSQLLRSIPGADDSLQLGKIRNLELAAARVDRLVVPPGGLFSFCRTVGRTVPSLGYVDGLELREGRMIASVGGGLCQLANLLLWMGLHAGMEIVERHRHGVDLFPDSNRRVPFGMGVSVFYNYLDMRMRNTLDMPLLIRASVEPPVLAGSISAPRDPGFEVTVEETDHRFFRDPDGTMMRENRIWRRTARGGGEEVVSELLAHNRCRVLYEVAEDEPGQGADADRE